MKKTIAIFLLVSAVLSFSVLSISSQEMAPAKNKENKVSSETEALRQRQNEGRKRLDERQREERKRLFERKREEKKRLQEQQKQEKQQIYNKNKEERKKILEQKGIEREKGKETRKALKERDKEIRRAKRAQKVIDVISSTDDPIIIVDASVNRSKTAYLKIKGIELEYKAKIKNNTTKIINLFTIVWEKGVPANKTQQQVETKIAQPLIPNKERIVKYNEIDNEIQGETYSVKVKKVIFEDGTEWQNQE